MESQCSLLPLQYRHIRFLNYNIVIYKSILKLQLKSGQTDRAYEMMKTFFGDRKIKLACVKGENDEIPFEEPETLGKNTRNTYTERAKIHAYKYRRKSEID